MIFDSHVHSSFSTDSNMKITDAIRSAKKQNVGIIITDHMDLNYPSGVGFRFNPTEYFAEYLKYRNDSLLIGIEIGMSESCKEENKKIIDNFNFDQVIGSQHTLNDMDISFPKLYKNTSYRNILESYFSEITNSILSHSYIDTLGHIDYISRYAPVNDSEIYYLHYGDLIDKVLKTCISTNTVMEINTRRIGNIDSFNNLKLIYSRYKELGGKYATIGSDSHNPKSINNNFKDALNLCELCSLKPIYFKNRKPEFF